MAASVEALCKQKGLSLLELADRSGLDLPKLRAIYQGRWTPTPAERQKIAGALDAELDDIAWGHTTPIQLIFQADGRLSGHGPCNDVSGRYVAGNDALTLSGT